MKKPGLASSVASLIFAVSFLSTSPAVHAQYKGAMSLNLNAGYASNNDGAFSSLSFTYAFANHVRIAPELGCVFQHKNQSAFFANIDMEFPFSISRGIYVYPEAGIAFQNWSNGDRSHARGGLNLGGGFDFNLTSQLKLGIQAKYTFLKDEGGAFIGMGIGYNF